MVVDTHVLIWLIEGDDRLGMGTRRSIEKARNDDLVIIPPISIWEMAHLTNRGRILVSLDPLAWIEIVLAMPGFALAASEPAIMVRAATMAWDHRDPADRMIVATAITLDAPLLTVDRKILAYAEEGHVKAIDARD